MENFVDYGPGQNTLAKYILVASQRIVDYSDLVETQQSPLTKVKLCLGIRHLLSYYHGLVVP